MTRTRTNNMQIHRLCVISCLLITCLSPPGWASDNSLNDKTTDNNPMPSNSNADVESSDVIPGNNDSNGTILDQRPDKLPVTVSDWALHYFKLCGLFCQNGTLVRTAKRCMDTVCFPCDCDETCVSRATCCPSMNDFENNVTFDESNILGRNKVSDAFKEAICQPLTTAFPDMEKTYLMVSFCPSFYNEPTTRLKCEQPTDNTLDSVIHYNDVHTGLLYRNIHCAVCNGLDLESSSHSHEGGRDTEESGKGGDSTRLRPLQFKASCVDYRNLMNITDFFTFYKTAATLAECKLGFKDTSGVTMCPGSMFGQEYTMCPMESGQSLRSACHNTRPAPALMMYNAKNPFCNVCNGASLTELEACPLQFSNIPGPPTLLLFGSRGQEEEEEEDISGMLDICGSKQEGPKTEPCVASTCPDGKIAVDDDRCETAFEEVRGLAYNFKFFLKSVNGYQKGLENQLLDAVNTSISERCPFLSHDMLMFIHTDCFFGNASTRRLLLTVTGRVVAPMSMSRDVFENQTLHAILNVPWDVSLRDSIGNAHTVSLKTVCIGNEMCNIYYSAVSPFHCDTFWFETRRGVVPRTEIEDVWIIPILSCPYVTLPWTGTPVVEDKKLIVTLDPDGSKEHNITMDWEPSGMSYEGGKVQMCVDMYKNSPALRGSHDVVEHTPNIISIVHYYLDTVCIFVSCVLLVVSIATYLMFPCLCSLPGLNTLCLCLCLFVAQLSLLITSLFGTRGYFSETYCLVHGIVLHYSWVASFVWMNTCCIHTYRVFTGIKIRYGLRNFVWYCVYSFGLPVVVIVVVILTTTMTTDGASIGYDRHVCFLDTSTTILIVVMGLLVPLLFSVTSNGVLFILTIKTILSMTRMKLQPKSSHGVITYVKLSTVTGVFCLFAATAIQFDNPVLSLIASPFAALQGVFIFASFIANKRVYKLYVGLISNRKQSSISSQNDVSVTTKT